MFAPLDDYVATSVLIEHTSPVPPKAGGCAARMARLPHTTLQCILDPQSCSVEGDSGKLHEYG